MSATAIGSRRPTTGQAGTAWAVGLGLLAGWTASGSVGILAGTLQATLTWLLLGAALLCVRPKVRPAVLWVMVGTIFLLVALPVVMGPVRHGLPLTVAVVLCLLASNMTGTDRRLMLGGSLAVLSLVLYRLAQQSIPAVWILSDALGVALGRLSGWAVGRPLEIGASFGGIDFLMVTGVWVAVWLTLLRAPRLGPAIFALGSLAAVHFLYLLAVAFTPELLRALPPIDLPATGDPYVPPPFSWSLIVAQMLPWNLPAIAAVLHVLLAVGLMQTGLYRSWDPLETAGRRTGENRWRSAAPVVALACLAVALPLFAIARSVPGLDGKRIIANRAGQLDWEVPQPDLYGQASAGMYGMLPSLVESLGGQLRSSAELSDAELDAADALIVLHPDTTLSLEQQDRIWRYVRDGGSLLVVTEGFVPDGALERRVDELLQPTAITVNQDAAVSQTKDWWGCLRVWDHPATGSAFPPAARPWSDLGASLNVRWPARPLAVGTWGWSAPEQEATWAGKQGFQPGAKLGDLVLAAEQRMGAGRVVVLGDNTSLTNAGLVDGYVVVGNLLSYLTAPAAGPQIFWRQLLIFVCLTGLLGFLAWHPSPTKLVTACVLLSCALAVAQMWTASASSVVPDGTRISPTAADGPTNRLAYIDATHLEPYSVHAWEFDALDGLALNLARNGYLPLMLHDFTTVRLERAGLLVSLAPSRRFSSAERAQLRQFVEQGGVLISMVGAEEAAASQGLLAEFGLRVPSSPVPTTAADPEPEPFGRTRAEYLKVELNENDRYMASIRLYAAWPVESQGGDADVLAYGRNRLPVVESDTQLPVVVSRAVGQGHVVLIGDTCFAMNKNLEYIGGEPFAGGYENAHFWRWVLTRVQGRPEWVPPRPPERKADAADDDVEATEEEES